MPTVVPFGPQHPILAEPIRFLLELQEEAVTGAEFEIGYMHRGIEKAMENDYVKNIFLAERVCGICSAVHSITYTHAVEKACDVQVPQRAKYIRTIMLELERLHSHILWLGIAAEAIGFENLFMLCWRDREVIMDLLETISGNRVHYGCPLPGGVRFDIDGKMHKHILSQLDLFVRSARKIERSLYNDYTLINRLSGIAVLSKAIAKKYGLVGPDARASGVNNDCRLDGYEAYDRLEFYPVLKEGGDNLDRVVIRIDEVFQSVDLIRQCLDQIEPGPILDEYKGRVGGEACFRAEAPRGELFYYIKGNGTKELERCKIRTPTLANVAMLKKLVIGLEYADVPITVLSFDPCMSCQDR